MTSAAAPHNEDEIVIGTNAIQELATLPARDGQVVPAVRPTPTAAAEPVLCVDLDGTLLATDLLFETVVALARKNPFLLLLIPFWLMQGKAVLKTRLAERATIDPASLPYREQVLLFLIEEKSRGRHIVLATASDHRLAGAVADHVGVFDEVLASRDGRNLKGAQKLRALEDRFGPGNFDYIGDAVCDLPIWKACRRAYVVSNGGSLLAKAGECSSVERLAIGKQGDLKSLLRLLRPHQWAKNLLLFVPLVLAHRLLELTVLWQVLCAFVAFGCCASSVYILNDLADLETDRRHATKRRRPLAAGTISLPIGAGLSALLAVEGFLIPTAAGLPLAFLGMLALYMVVTTAYSLHLKRVALLDVFILAGLYAHRVLSGGVAAETAVSGWLIAFSVFLFVSLALAKRHTELSRAVTERRSEPDRRGYQLEDLGLTQSLGIAAGCAAVLPLCLYVNGPDVTQLYRSPDVLWVVCLVVFYWIARVWLLAGRRLLHEDPVFFALRDRVSYLAGAVIVASLLLASF